MSNNVPCFVCFHRKTSSYLVHVYYFCTCVDIILVYIWMNCHISLSVLFYDPTCLNWDFFCKQHFRIEVLRVKTAAGAAKLAGVVACLGGAATLAFYKGPQLELLSHFHFLGNYHKTQQHQGHVLLSGSSWIKGCFLMLLSNTFWGMWLVLQVINFFFFLIDQLVNWYQLIISILLTDILLFLILILFFTQPDFYHKRLPFKAATHNSSMFLKLNSVFSRSVGCRKRLWTMEIGLEYQTRRCVILCNIFNLN